MLELRPEAPEELERESLAGEPPLRCDPTNELIACAERKAATQRGEFFHDYRLGGWVYVHTPPRRPLGARGHYFNEGPLPPMLHTEICPFCGGGLPELATPPSDCD